MASTKTKRKNDFISNSPHCLTYNSYDVSFEHFGVGSTMDPLIDIYLTTFLLDIVLIL